MAPAIAFLPTHYPLPITHYPLPITHYPLPITQMLPIDTDFAIGNEVDLADQILQERESLKHLRVLLNGLEFSHKIAIAQIACNQIASTEPIQLIKLKPVGEHFDDRINSAILFMASLPPETLAEIAIEILEEPRDQNE